MGTVDVCLKRSFIILTCIIGLFSCLSLGLTLFGHGHYHATDELEDMIIGIHIMYGISTVILLLAIIGMCGAVKDKSWMLIVFSVGMSLTALFLAYDFFVLLVSKNEILEDVRKEHQELWPPPLEALNKTAVESLYELQHNLGCCGVDKGYQDWGDNIHPSCVCSEDTAECIPAPSDSSLYKDKTSSQTILIYKQPCVPLLMDLTNYIFGICVGFWAFFLLILLASLMHAIWILVQLRRKVEVPPVYYSAEAKAGNYACLAEVD